MYIYNVYAYIYTYSICIIWKNIAYHAYGNIFFCYVNIIEKDKYVPTIS